MSDMSYHITFYNLERDSGASVAGNVSIELPNNINHITKQPSVVAYSNIDFIKGFISVVILL